jgi:5'-nucleotidase
LLNVASTPRAEQGWSTRLGRRHKAEDVVVSRSRGRNGVLGGAAGAAADAGEGTDFHAVEAGYASLTPLQIDLTNRDQMPAIVNWLDQ